MRIRRHFALATLAGVLVGGGACGGSTSTDDGGAAGDADAGSTGTAGTGGSGGVPWECQAHNECDNCCFCQLKYCCAETNACWADEACTAVMMTCSRGVVFDDAGIGACHDAVSAGGVLAHAWYDCARSSCTGPPMYTCGIP